MAEKYGTVPKKFTREWWDYFWTYYKWYVLVAAFLIITVSITIYQKATQPRYDLTIAYAGERIFSEEFENEFTKEASKLCEDVDKNGEKSVLFTQMNLSADAADAEYAMAMQTKLDLSISEEDIFIYILDKKVADTYSGESADDSCFIPLSDWYKGVLPEGSTYNVHGVDYGIKLSECEFFNTISSDFEKLTDTYIFVRYYPRKDQIKEQADGHKAAMKLAEKLIKG